MHWKVLLVVSVITILYVLLGGVVFHYLESPKEESTAISAAISNTLFLRNFTCISQAQLRVFVEAVINAYDAGVLVLDNTTSSSSNWDFSSSFFFSWTVITTIGYGHISPSTGGGRVFCCLYALFGIPIVAILLSGLGEKLGILPKKLFGKLETKISSKKGFAALKITILTLVILILFFIIPAACFTVTEGWTFGEGMYYCMITLSTIGFGDFVPGQNTADTGVPGVRVLQRIGLIVWILCGLSVLALVIGEIGELMKKRADEAEERLNKSTVKKLDTDEESSESIKTEHAELQTKTTEVASPKVCFPSQKEDCDRFTAF